MATVKPSVAALGHVNNLNVTRVTLSRLLNGKAGVSPEMAVRLALALGTSAEMWLTMQSKYDLWQARKAMRKLKIQPLAKPPLAA